LIVAPDASDDYRMLELLIVVGGALGVSAARPSSIDTDGARPERPSRRRQDAQRRAPTARHRLLPRQRQPSDPP
jgi:hypothetical protein